MKHLKRRIIFVASLGCIMSLQSFAQDITVQGQVVDETGYPLIGAKVISKGTETRTNQNGDFTIEVPADSKIKFKYPNHSTQVKKVYPKMIVTLPEFKRVTWNARAGLNLGGIIPNENNKFDKQKIGFQAGVGMEYAFTRNWVVQPSLMFYKKVYYDTTFNQNFEEDVKKGYDKWVADVYVGQFNMLFGYRWRMANDFNLVFAVGPTFGYSFDGTLKKTLNNKGETVTTTKFKIFDAPKEGYSGNDTEILNQKIKEFDRFNIGVMGNITAEYNRYFISLETAYEEHNTSAISFGIKF